MKKREGFTILELTIVMGIAALIFTTAGVFSVSILRYNRTMSSQIDVERQSRQFMKQFSHELRTASSSSLGGYSIETANATSLVFYANIDSDDLRERVRYYLNGTSLMRGVINPSGVPLTYNPAEETTFVVVEGVRNSDIFSYYDQVYAATETPLALPVTVSDIRLVHVKIVIDYNTSEPPGAITIESSATIRNLKNL